MHMSYGPSNLRMWELPINGAMQITDNPKGTSKLFDLDKEIVCFDNGKIDQAIDLIDYYLANDAERVEIARQGYNKVKSRYSFQQTYWDIMPKLQQGMIEKVCVL
jgi:spore maturation protein CgeB